MNIDKKFNKEIRDACKKLKAINKQIKEIAVNASSCVLSDKSRKEFSEAAIPFLEAESIMYEKGLDLYIIEDDDYEEIENLPEC